MEIGARVEKQVKLYVVRASGEGEDDPDDKYYAKEEDATFALAIDGADEGDVPEEVTVYQLSDGTFVKTSQVIELTPPPNEEAIDGLVDDLPPVAKAILRRMGRLPRS